MNKALRYATPMLCDFGQNTSALGEEEEERKLAFTDDFLCVTNFPKCSKFVRAFYLNLSFEHPE